MSKSQDAYSKSGAERLVERILTYWHDRGYHGITATKYQAPDFPSLWFVRSNVGWLGYPPRRVGRAA